MLRSKMTLMLCTTWLKTMSRRPKNEAKWWNLSRFVESKSSLEQFFTPQTCWSWRCKLLAENLQAHRICIHGVWCICHSISKQPFGSNSPVAWAYRDLGTSAHGSSALPICAYVVDLRCGTWDNTQHVFFTHSSMKNYEAMWQVHLCDSHGLCVLELCHLSISLHRTKERRDSDEI